MTDNDNLPTDPIGLDVFGLPDGVVLLHDWLVMRRPTGDAAERVARLILRGGTGKLQLTAPDTRKGLRVLLDDLDSARGVTEAIGVPRTGGLIAELRDAMETGQASEQLVPNVIETLEVTLELAKACQRISEGSDDETLKSLRSMADSLRFWLEKPQS
jgi:hypothetical protein